MTLTDFLLARIAEDEADPWRGAELIGTDRIVGSAEADALAAEEREWVARVLADCEAKRRIVEHCACGDWTDPNTSNLSLEECASEGETLALLALPYADHPDYQPEWHPDPPPAPPRTPEQEAEALAKWNEEYPMVKTPVGWARKRKGGTDA